MQVSTRLAFQLALCALAAGATSTPSRASAQATGGNPGQFGGGAPGQFNPNAAPAGGTTTPPPGGTSPTPSPFGGMNAGGLTPPPPNQPVFTTSGTASGTTSGTTSATDQRLDEAKAEDSGRGLTWFWLEVGGGVEHVGLQTIDEAAGLEPGCAEGASGCSVVEGGSSAAIATTGTGGMLDGGLGLRLLFFTVGARGRIGFFDGFDLARVGGELGLRIPIGSIEPRINVGFGYAALMNLTSDGGTTYDDASASGYYTRLGGGLDVFVSNNISLGGDASADLIGLSRDIEASDGSGGSGVLDGASVGLGVALGVHAGLHL